MDPRRVLPIQREIQHGEPDDERNSLGHAEEYPHDFGGGVDAELGVGVDVELGVEVDVELGVGVDVGVGVSSL